MKCETAGVDVLGLCAIYETARDYLTTHGHWPHDSECAHSLAHEAGHYEGEFMKDRHWTYDSSVKCDCKLGALSRAVLGYENTQSGDPSPKNLQLSTDNS